MSTAAAAFVLQT